MSDLVIPPIDDVTLPGLTAPDVELHGQLQVAASTWFVYGHTSYDGEVVVGRYQDARQAAEVLRRGATRCSAARPAGPTTASGPCTTCSVTPGSGSASTGTASS
jgi:hypothetical protein